MARNVIPLTNLIEQFERMPGIGHKSAQKLAFYILGMSDEEAKRFADNILLFQQIFLRFFLQKKKYIAVKYAAI